MIEVGLRSSAASMKSIRIALVASLFAVACDDSSPKAAAGEEAKPEASASAKGSAPAPKSIDAPPLKLPDGAEAAAKPLLAKYSADDGFSGDFSDKDLPGLLWHAAHATDPLVVESAFHTVVEVVDELEDQALVTARTQLSAVALRRIGDKEVEVFSAALQALEPALAAPTVDASVISAMEELLTNGPSLERKVEAAGALGNVSRDPAAAVTLAKVAFASSESAVVAEALGRSLGRHPGVVELAEPFLSRPEPAYVAGAVDLFAGSAVAKTPKGQAKLLEFVESKDPYLRAIALKTYAKVAKKGAAAEIAKHLDDTTAIKDGRVPYKFEDGSTRKAGVHAYDPTIQRAALNAISQADTFASTKFPRADWNDPASVKKTIAAAKAWAKENS